MPSRKQEKALRQSHFKKTRKKQNFFVVEGERALSELLKSDWRVLNLFATAEKLHKVRALIPFESMLEAEELSASKMAEWSETETPSRILALVEKKTFSIDQVAAERRLLILDNLRDPGNVGTLLRTAHSFGWNGVVMLKGTAELFSPKVVRSTTGALFHLKIVEHIHPPDALSALKKQSFQIWGADSHSGVSPDECRRLIHNPSAKVALVIGAEASGLSRLVLAKADGIIRIPLSEGVESLNAAVSGGILMYLLRP